MTGRDCTYRTEEYSIFSASIFIGNVKLRLCHKLCRGKGFHIVAKTLFTSLKPFWIPLTKNVNYWKLLQEFFFFNSESEYNCLLK